MIPRTCLVLLSLPFMVLASELNVNDANNGNALRRTVAIRRPLVIIAENAVTEQVTSSLGFIPVGSKRSLSESETLQVGKKGKELEAALYFNEAETSTSCSRADSPFVPLPLPDLPETSSFPSCMKGTRPPRGAVSFNSEAIEASTYEKFGIEAETDFFNALNAKKFNITFAMRQQGLLLSHSSIVFNKVKAILSSKSPSQQFIGFLFKHYPHVFTQKYLPAFGSVFKGISQNNALLILNGYSSLRSAHLEIFKEYVRNPELNLGDSFNYLPVRYEQIQEMIKWAEKAERKNILAEIIAKTRAPISLNSSILFDAITSMSLERIKLILQRPDWFYLIVHKPESGKYEKTTAVDLAVKMYDDSLDESYEVMKLLLTVLPKIGSINNLNISERLLTEFVNNCIEADDNLEIVKELRSGLESIINSDLEIDPKIFALVEDQLTHLLFEEESDEDTVMEQESETESIESGSDIEENDYELISELNNGE